MPPFSFVRTIVPLILIAVSATPGETALAACDLEPGGTGVIAEVLDAETVRLEDGMEIRLINMVSPRTPLWLGVEHDWHAALAAEASLSEMTLGTQVRYAFGDTREDRYGRTLAHLFVQPLENGEPEVWVQGEMIAKGRARAASFRDNRACMEVLLGREAEARDQSLGLWADEHYRIRSADDVDEVARLLNHFHVVEGVVHNVAERSARSYLNFAEDWREDFTISIARSARRLFEDAGIDLKDLAGARIRVRGWIRNLNGPMIEVSHPEQMELLDQQIPEEE